MKGMLSVIIPAYNEEKMIKKAVFALSSILSDAEIPFELIFVNDGSSDGTWKEIIKASNDPLPGGADCIGCVRGICFSRNFGKEAALFAGLSKAKGDCVLTIDCDLQHPPEKIPEMYRLWQDGYEVIEGVKKSRGKESAAHLIAARVFYRIISRASGFDMNRASDFKLLDRKAVDALISMPERHAFFRALSSWVGFRTTEVEFDVMDRTEGESKWSVTALTKYALSNITSFSTAPMQIVTMLGIIMLLISVVLGAISIGQKVLGLSLGGFTTVIIIELFVGSIVMISLGIIGYYIAKIYEEVIARPRYIITSECRSEKRTEQDQTEDRLTRDEQD